MEYAIRQSEAIAREGVEVYFLCKSSFPFERLADGIKVREFNKSRGPSDQSRGLTEKILRGLRMISDLRSEAKHVVKLAYQLSQNTSTRYHSHATPTPAWDRYENENSWEKNARRVCQAFES